MRLPPPPRLRAVFASLPTAQFEANRPVPYLGELHEPIAAPLITLWSDVDELWTPDEMQLWDSVLTPSPLIDVSDGTGAEPAAARAAAKFGPGRRCDYQLSGISHWDLVQSEPLMKQLFAALVDAAASLVV
jgi:hypothetical protein